MTSTISAKSSAWISVSTATMITWTFSTSTDPSTETSSVYKAKDLKLVTPEIQMLLLLILKKHLHLNILQHLDIIQPLRMLQHPLPLRHPLPLQHLLLNKHRYLDQLINLPIVQHRQELRPNSKNRLLQQVSLPQLKRGHKKETHVDTIGGRRQYLHLVNLDWYAETRNVLTQTKLKRRQ